VPLELHEDGRDVGRQCHDAVLRHLHQSHRQGKKGSCYDPDQESTMHPLVVKHAGHKETQEGYPYMRVGHLSQGEHGVLIPDDDAPILQPEESDEEPNPHGNGILDGGRDALHDHLTHVEESEQHEDDPFNENRRQGHLPGVTQAKHHRESEERVETHTRGLCHRQVGNERHEERTQHTGQRCGCEEG
jgi:hypothetical protein